MTYHIELPSSKAFDLGPRYPRRSRSLRVLLILVGLLLAMNVLTSPVSMDASPVRHRGYEALRLIPADEIQVISEIDLPHDQLFGGSCTGATWGDTHIWGHIQRVQVAADPGYIHYFEFRDESDASAAKLKFDEIPVKRVSPMKARVFGRFLVIFQGPSESARAHVVAQEIFSAIADRFGEGESGGVSLPGKNSGNPVDQTPNP